jgi:hypothetical protein
MGITMNIVCVPPDPLVAAKTCGCKNSGSDVRQKVTYAFSQEFHSLCIDKKEILQAQIEACQKLLRSSMLSVSERSAVEKEIEQLTMALDLLS